MDVSSLSTKEIGNRGERAAELYLIMRGYWPVARNIRYKTGEIDRIMRRNGTLHFIEVKTIRCREFPGQSAVIADFDPSGNLHARKIRKVKRTAEWYTAEHGWKGAVQIDAALVWIRVRDGKAKVAYLPQIL
ncbi:MAG TPA: YraN family protein [Candidatus Paceibacterota bacterium]|nr:YraN family protein [Candidatus Paceibacterota bacterium]